MKEKLIKQMLKTLYKRINYMEYEDMDMIDLLREHEQVKNDILKIYHLLDVEEVKK